MSEEVSEGPATPPPTNDHRMTKESAFKDERPPSTMSPGKNPGIGRRWSRMNPKVCPHGKLYVLCKSCEEVRGASPVLGKVLFGTLCGVVNSEAVQGLKSSLEVPTQRVS